MGTVRMPTPVRMSLMGLAGCLLAGCPSSSDGSLVLTLSLPSQPDLRPTGMTTVTITATVPGESPIGTTSVLSTGSVSAGDLPVGDEIQIGVVLRDVSNRIVGVGEAGQSVNLVGDQATKLSIPVRRPFVYAASGTALYSFDPTLDPRDPKFQTMLAGVTGPQFTVSVGGDRLAVISGNQVQIVVTATNTVTGMIQVPSGVTDAAAVPGSHKLAVAHGAGIAIVDLDTSSVANAMVGPVDRVTVGPGSDGAMVAYGLVGRVLPPEKPMMLATCTGTSKIVAVAVDAPATAMPASVTAAISDLAAAPDLPMLFATLPCTGKVAKVGGVIEGGGLTLTDVVDLERAAVLTVAGDRVWAAGTKMAAPACTSGCTATTPVACPQPAGNHLAFVTEGAHIIVKSIPLDGGMPITLDAPGRRETMVDKNDTARQHAQLLKALGVVPSDLVTLPGGQYVGLITKSRYYIEELTDGFGQRILPCLDATTADWLLIDMASSSISQRVRTSCAVIVGTGAFFDKWECDDPPAGERNAFTQYQPTSIGALFGSR
ncbi:hypothetical protein BH11MYX3_BH11MYX3_05540 [soil metagenome]